MEQGTVARFDASTGSGVVVDDTGMGHEFNGAAFAASGLRLLRPGQRVRVERDSAGRIILVTVLTVAS